MRRHTLGSLLLSGIGTISKGSLPHSQELVLLEISLWRAFPLHTSSEDRPDGSQAVRAGLVWRGSCDVLPLLGQEVLLSYRVSFREEDFAQSLIYKRTAVSASLLSKTESPEVDGGVAGYLWRIFGCFAWTSLLYSDLAM